MNLVLHDTSTERLYFRKLQQEDFKSWLPFHQDKETSKHWKGLPKNPTTACKEDFDRSFYRYEHKLGGKMALLKKDTQELVGLAGLLVQEINQKKELEIAYSLLPKFWGYGYAQEAAKHCKLTAQEHQLATSLISIISVTNIPSQKVAQSIGMTLDFETSYAANPVYIYRLLL